MQASGNVATATPQLDVNSVSDIIDKFGVPGDHIVKPNSPSTKGRYQKCVQKTVKNDGLYGRGRYLVQNKGLVLGAIDKPLPGMRKGNDTEKAVILAIAMQASAFFRSKLLVWISSASALDAALSRVKFASCQQCNFEAPIGCI